ncbi:MAG TPA: hypothetical protein VK752_00915 [Bryobacteraceae bacterium]|nr:hypothetical protein [Bryobacteraceae bacterium]
MIALAATGTNHSNFLASMSMPATHAAPQTPSFVNMIGLFLSSPNGAPQQGTATQNTTKASPAQIAQSMIRSMLGSPTVVSSGPMLGGTTLASSDNPVSAATAQQPAPASTTALIEDASTASTTDPAVLGSQKGTSKTASANPAPQAPQKPAGSQPDAPAALSAAIPPVAIPVAAALPSVSQPSAQPAQDRKSDGATPVREKTGETPIPASPAKSSPEAEVAFTAILTPMKAAVPSNTGDASPQVASQASQESGDGASTSAAPASSLPATAAAQQPQIGIRAGGEGANSGDTSQEQQGDSPAPSRAAAATADQKAKPADGTAGDIGLQAAIGHDRASNVTSLVETSSGDQTRGTSETQSDTPAPFQSTAEALRTSESNLPPAAQSRSGAAQEISIRIAQPDAAPVDLRVIERGGLVHVDVRTSDPAMQTSLRQDLGTLTNSLERAGYHSETFTSTTTLSRAASSSQTSNQDDRQDASQNRNGGGDFSGGRRQQQQQQKRPSPWLEELEDQQ